jgi:hypothetical protein
MQCHVRFTTVQRFGPQADIANVWMSGPGCMYETSSDPLWPAGYNQRGLCSLYTLPITEPSGKSLGLSAELFLALTNRFRHKQI